MTTELERARGKFFAHKGRKLAYSMTSPSTIVITGVAAALTIALGAPVAAIVGVLAGAYAVKVAASTFSPQEVADILNPKVSLSGLRNPYKDWVHQGLVAKERYERALRDTSRGPLRDRLSETADDMDDVLSGLVRIARRAQGLDDYLRTPTARTAAQSLATARARLEETTDPEMRRERERIVSAFEEQVGVAERMYGTYERAVSRVESTVANLDQLSAQLIEVNLAASDSAALPDPTAKVDDLVKNLRTVRDAVAELDEFAVDELPVQEPVPEHQDDVPAGELPEGNLPTGELPADEAAPKQRDELGEAN